MALKGFVILGLTAFVLTGCGETGNSGLRITNPDDETVEFTGYYESDYTARTEVDGVTRASYKVETYKDTDHIRAGFVKTDTTDSTSPLNIKLFHAGKRDEAEVTIPGDTAFIDYEY
ncbi:hypothetical protein JXM67_02180 [candidate division WOR-3 bacterium]|nr:hypothetical protein [candidate division WOR-3 bacterium]